MRKSPGDCHPRDNGLRKNFGPLVMKSEFGILSKGAKLTGINVHLK